MNAFELSEKKIRIMKRINYLRAEANENNTDTVLLTNDEVEEIIESMNECIDVINLELAKITVF